MYMYFMVGLCIQIVAQPHMCSPLTLIYMYLLISLNSKSCPVTESDLIHSCIHSGNLFSAPLSNLFKQGRSRKKLRSWISGVCIEFGLMFL